LEYSGILDLMPDQVISSQGQLNGKRFKLPIVVNCKRGYTPIFRSQRELDKIGFSSLDIFFPIYVEGKRFLLDPASPETIFTGPLPYLKLPHSPVSDCFIMNTNINFVFEAPHDIISMETIVSMVEQKDA